MIPVVYVAGKFRGRDPWEVHRNVCEAELWAFDVAQLGAMPLCPHTNTAHFDGTLSAEFWLEGTLELLRRCDAVFATPNWTRSAGARAEVADALTRNVPVFASRAGLGEWILAWKAGESGAAERVAELYSRPVRVMLAELGGGE